MVINQISNVTLGTKVKKCGISCFIYVKKENKNWIKDKKYQKYGVKWEWCKKIYTKKPMPKNDDFKKAVGSGWIAFYFIKFKYMDIQVCKLLCRIRVTTQ